MEFLNTARCKHQIAIRDNCIPRSSRQIARKKAVSRDADRNPASQTRVPPKFFPAPTELPATSPYSTASLKFPRSASPDTKNPTKIPHPPRPNSPAPRLDNLLKSCSSFPSWLRSHRSMQSLRKATAQNTAFARDTIRRYSYCRNHVRNLLLARFPFAPLWSCFRIHRPQSRIANHDI